MQTTTYGIVGVPNVTVTMLHTSQEVDKATNSEGSLVVGKLHEASRRRIASDGATETKLFPITN